MNTFRNKKQVIFIMCKILILKSDLWNIISQMKIPEKKCEIQLI